MGFDGYTRPVTVISHRAGWLPNWVEVCFDTRAFFDTRRLWVDALKYMKFAVDSRIGPVAVGDPSAYRTAFFLLLLILDFAYLMTSFQNRKSRVSIEAPRNDQQ